MLEIEILPWLNKHSYIHQLVEGEQNPNLKPYSLEPSSQMDDFQVFE